MHYEFQLVDYEVADNVTRDSRYATFTDTGDLKDAENQTTSYTGRVRALSVNEIKETIAQGSTTAVDREPLVRVLVKTKAGDVMLDGYILIHITNTKANLAVATYPEFDLKFDFCNGVVGKTDWAQFSKLILQDAMNNYEKQTFDFFYWADCYTKAGSTDYLQDLGFVNTEAEKIASITNAPYDGHINTYSMKIFNFGKDIYGTLDATHKDPTDPSMAKGNHNGKLETSNAFENKALGVVEYYPNTDGQTNHTWRWYLTADEVEYLTHDKANNDPVYVTRWIRFQAKTFQEANAAMPGGVTQYTQDNYNAPYPFIWVKMTMKLTRDAKTGKYATKIPEYWYHYNTGADEGWSGILFDIEAPRGGTVMGCTNTQASIKDKNWDGTPAYKLDDNVVNAAKLAAPAAGFGTAKKGLYYFAPKTYTITTQKGNTYTITPKRKSTDTDWDRLYCKYVVKNQLFTKTPTANQAKVLANTDYHTWNEAQLKDIMAKCAIDYNRGALTNDTLYAVSTSGVYTPIAYIIRQEFDSSKPLAQNVEAGRIRLGHWLIGNKISDTPATENEVCYEVLNAIGFAENNANIEKQLRSWLGFVGNYGCDVAYYVEQEQYDGNNVATFMTSWERPINLNNITPDDAIDAKTLENTIYLIDYIKLFDWRGDKTGFSKVYDGYMYDDHFWFWGNYNIKAITVDLRTSVVETSLGANVNWVKLNTVTNYLRLWPLNASTSGVATYNLPDLTVYNDPSQEAALEQLMGINPVNNAKKAVFGGFYYENITGNVTEFWLRFPITIRYEWGELTDWVVWHVDRTGGH